MIRVSEADYLYALNKCIYEMCFNGGDEFFEFQLVGGDTIFCDYSDFPHVNWTDFPIDDKVQLIKHHIPEYNENGKFVKRVVKEVWNSKGTVWYLNCFSFHKRSETAEVVACVPIKKIYDWRLNKWEMKEKVLKEDIHNLINVLNSKYGFDEDDSPVELRVCLTDSIDLEYYN